MVLHHVTKRITQHQWLAPAGRVLVGVSGGVDSVVLLAVLKRLGYAPEGAHMNHRLRGAAAEEDAAFVQRLCDALAVPLHLETIDTAAYAEAHNQTIQEAARTCRYDFFARIAETEALAYVAVAHHLDDQAETVLLNLLRGTGLEGLAGMPVQRALGPESRATLIRPLLDLRQAEILAYAREAGLTWRDDASNQSFKYKRNVLRLEVLPLLEQHFGAAASVNIVRAARLVRGYVEDTFRQDLAAHFEHIARPDVHQLDLEGLCGLTSLWRQRLILEAFQRWMPEAPRHAALAGEVEALLNAQPGRRMVLKQGTVWRARDGLVFSAAEAAAASQGRVPVHPNRSVALGAGRLQVDLLDGRPPRHRSDVPSIEIVDADVLDFPLMARRWQPGDRFQPLGMAGSKKISDFLTDAKVPVHRRDEVWVLHSRDEIVWVIGLRLADCVRVQGTTTRFAKFTYIQPS